MMKLMSDQQFVTLQSPLASFHAPPNEPEPLMEIVGQSPQMKRVWKLVWRFAPSDVPVVLQGESGTGKDLFAQVIHHLSPRRLGSFMPLDCANLSERWFDNALFSHETMDFGCSEPIGSGLLDLAAGGTLFLDHISNLSETLQARLLRALQEFEIFPWEANQPDNLNVRIIAATNMNLKEAVYQGVFREDLYYRLATVTIELPPLRDRQGDIKLLCEHFINIYNRRFGKSVSGVSDAVLDIFSRHTWPGNVRELENAMLTSMLLAYEQLHPHHLPAYLQTLYVFPTTFSG